MSKCLPSAKVKKLEKSELPGPVAKTNLLTHSPRKELHPSHFLKRSVMAELRSEKHSVLPVYKFKLLLPFTQYTVPQDVKIKKTDENVKLLLNGLLLYKHYFQAMRR